MSRGWQASTQWAACHVTKLTNFIKMPQQAICSSGGGGGRPCSSSKHAKQQAYQAAPAAAATGSHTQKSSTHQRAAASQGLQQGAVGQLGRSAHKAAADELDEAARIRALRRVQHKAALQAGAMEHVEAKGQGQLPEAAPLCGLLRVQHKADRQAQSSSGSGQRWALGQGRKHQQEGYKCSSPAERLAVMAVECRGPCSSS